MYVYNVIETCMGDSPIVYPFFIAEEQLIGDVKEEAVLFVATEIADRLNLEGDAHDAKVEVIVEHFELEDFYEFGEYWYDVQLNFFQNV